MTIFRENGSVREFNGMTPRDQAMPTEGERRITMRIFQETVYWMALAHLPRWKTARINQISLDILQQRQLALAEFFACPPTDWQQEFSLSPKEVSDLEQAQQALPEYAALTETAQ